MTSVADMIKNLEARGSRIVQSRDGRYGFKTLGGTISYAGKTEASAIKKMKEWDENSRYWEAYHAARR